MYRLERISLKDTTRDAYHPSTATDPAADEIIRQREELCKLQDKFLENMADNFQDLDMTLMSEIEAELETETSTIKKISRPCFLKLAN